MKKLFNFLEEQAVKLLVGGLAAFIIMMIITDGSTSEPLPIIVILLSMLAFALGALGLVLRVLHALADGVKSISKKLSKKFGKSSAKRKQNSDIITLTAKSGEQIDFKEIAGIAYGGNFYAILQPVKLLKGMKSNEALVFKVTRKANGDDTFDIELNDAIVSAVFKEYDKLVDAELKKRRK